MTKLYIMGTANAIPSLKRDNSYLFVENGNQSILIDCGLQAFIKLQQMGIAIGAVSDIIVTHFHPDHVSSLPLLIMDWWLLGRKEPLTFHGLKYTLDRLKVMMDLYDWVKWPGFFPVSYHEVSPSYDQVLKKQELSIYSNGVKHLIPTLGIRFEIGTRVIAYSCDTEASEGVVELARNADVLIHEAAGEAVGHSTARLCGMNADKAGVKTLYLIHYPDDADMNQMLSDAREQFEGKIILAEDQMLID